MKVSLTEDQVKALILTADIGLSDIGENAMFTELDEEDQNAFDNTASAIQALRRALINPDV